MFENDDPDFENSHDKTKQMPLYKKGEEIFQITKQLLELAPENNEHIEFTKGWMLECASFLTVKVAGAEAGDLYDIRMENAALIRRAARELVVNTNSLKMFGFEHTHYFDLLRDAVEEYRILFVAWVESFDTENYFIDRWGVFNPPGVGPHDKDPDDDIPFNPDDFLS